MVESENGGPRSRHMSLESSARQSDDGIYKLSKAVDNLRKLLFQTQYVTYTQHNIDNIYRVGQTPTIYIEPIIIL